MKYVPIEKCGNCPYSRHGFRLDDGTTIVCTGAVDFLNCPLLDLPEWRLLAEGDVMQDGDIEYDAHEDEWSPVLAEWIGRKWDPVHYWPVRRRLGGGK